MEEKIRVDIEELGRQINVPFFTRSSPDGKHHMDIQQWSKPYLQQALELVAPYAGKPVVLSGHVDPWVTMAIRQRILSPNLIYGGPQGEMPQYTLAHGEPDPNLDAVFNILEEDGNVYINFTSDKPGVTEGHSFNPADIPKIVVPDFPAGTNIFMHGLGMYPVQIAVCGELAKTCGSLFLAAHDAEVYTCAVCNNGLYEPGDTVPRKYF
jgi:hypothetical protein